MLCDKAFNLLLPLEITISSTVNDLMFNWIVSEILAEQSAIGLSRLEYENMVTLEGAVVLGWLRYHYIIFIRNQHDTSNTDTITI